MSLATENLKNRQLRGNLQKIVQEECSKANIEAKNEYNLFVGVKNTGEQVKLPDAATEVYNVILERFKENCKTEVYVSHKNLHV